MKTVFTNSYQKVILFFHFECEIQGEENLPFENLTG